jgi:hypothetical protein
MIKTSNKLGIIQTRGLGDLVVALPIARYYYEQGRQIYWPINGVWVEQMRAAAPWVNWMSLENDRGLNFYDIPYHMLVDAGVEDIMPLYHSLTGHPEFTDAPWFQHTSFDQYKYIRAGVPFVNKWSLSECVTRNPEREAELIRKYVPQGQPYVVTHLTGSEFTATFDESIIPEDWAVVPIVVDGYLFDWLGVIEGAEAAIMTDSVFANIVDQMRTPVDKYFVPLHHIGATPVHGCDWTWIPNTTLRPQVNIFRSG